MSVPDDRGFDVMSRSIATRFSFWFAALSVAFLVIGSALSIRISSAIQKGRLKDRLEAEARSAAAVASQSYGIGDLVAMRTALAQLAAIGNWSRSDFINTNG